MPVVHHRATLPPSGHPHANLSQWKTLQSLPKTKVQSFEILVADRENMCAVLRKNLHYSYLWELWPSASWGWSQQGFECVCVRVGFPLLSLDTGTNQSHIITCGMAGRRLKWISHFITPTQTFVHSCAQIHTNKLAANHSWAPALSPRRWFDWFWFLQAFRFNMQLESDMCESLWVCLCIRLSVVSAATTEN